MAENLITNANDVELVMEAGGTKRGTSQQFGRMVVDEFTVTREEDAPHVSGVGHRLPLGLTNGDIIFSFEFTMLGSDLEVFDMVADSDGRSKLFSFTARKTDDNGNVEWEYAFDICKATTEEQTGTSGDPMEYNVSGNAARMDRQVNN